MVELDVGREAAGVAADDGEGEREAVARRAHDGLGAAADADPGPERRVLHRRIDADALERRAHRPLPMDRLAGPVGVPQGREDRELLLEQIVVVVERIAEERERLGERAPSENHLCAAV